MNTPQDPPADGAPDEARSGADVGEAIEVAERGSAAEGQHDGGDQPGPAPVERAGGDPEMTEGQVVLGEGSPTASDGPDPTDAGSGGAQSVIGPRTSDRLSAGEPKPAGRPFDAD
jgi:hypothetical protein